MTVLGSQTQNANYVYVARVCCCCTKFANSCCLRMCDAKLQKELCSFRNPCTNSKLAVVAIRRLHKHDLLGKFAPIRPLPTCLLLTCSQLVTRGSQSMRTAVFQAPHSLPLRLQLSLRSQVARNRVRQPSYLFQVRRTPCEQRNAVQLVSAKATIIFCTAPCAVVVQRSRRRLVMRKSAADALSSCCS